MSLVALVLACLAPAQDAPAVRDAFSTDHELARVPAGVIATYDMAFAPDGSQVAYVGARNGKLVPVIGEEVGDEFDVVDPPIYAADSAHVAFRVAERTKQREHWWIVRDGKRVAFNEWIGPLSWSPDGSKLAYWTRPGSKLDDSGKRVDGEFVFVIEGRKSEPWQVALVDEPAVWSSDSSTVVTTAAKLLVWRVLANHEVIAQAQKVTELSLSADGSRFAARLLQIPDPKRDIDAPPGMGPLVISLGEDSFGYSFESTDRPRIAPNGRRVAFAAQRGSDVGIAINDEPAKLAWNWVSTPVWSKDSAHVAFAGVQEPRVTRPVISIYSGPDRLARDSTCRLVVDGEELADEYDELRDIVFSDDGSLVAARAKKDGKWRVVCGAAASEPYDFVGAPRFSNDGRLVAFGARRGDALLWSTLATK